MTKTDELARQCPAPDPADLASLQRWMSALLRHDRDLSADPTMRAAAAQHFGGNARVSPAEQIEIYREQFWLRHTATLIEDFPGLSGVLGQTDWNRLTRGYLTDFPPRSPSLRDLGAHLAEHVVACDWLPHHALCVDMARLEWAYVEVFDAPEPPALSASELLQLPEDAWERARIRLSPALRLLRLEHPVAELRRQLRARRAEATPPQLPAPRPLQTVVYRHQLRLWDRSLAPVPFALLERLDAGVPLVAACEAVLSRFPEAEETVSARLGDWFTAWGRMGWITGVELAVP